MAKQRIQLPVQSAPQAVVATPVAIDHVSTDLPSLPGAEETPRPELPPVETAAPPALPANPGPIETLPLVAMQQTLVITPQIPVAANIGAGYVSRRVDLHLCEEDAVVLRRIVEALDTHKEMLADGRTRVTTGPLAVRWLLEQFGRELARNEEPAAAA